MFFSEISSITVLVLVFCLFFSADTLSFLIHILAPVSELKLAVVDIHNRVLRDRHRRKKYVQNIILFKEVLLVSMPPHTAAL